MARQRKGGRDRHGKTTGEKGSECEAAERYTDTEKCTQKVTFYSAAC